MDEVSLTATIRLMRNLGACRDEITGHNTGIRLLSSTSVWVLLSTPIAHRETRPTAQRLCPRRVKVAQSLTFDQAGDWTCDLHRSEILPTVPISYTYTTSRDYMQYNCKAGEIIMKGVPNEFREFDRWQTLVKIHMFYAFFWFNNSNHPLISHREYFRWNQMIKNLCWSYLCLQSIL